MANTLSTADRRHLFGTSRHTYLHPQTYRPSENISPRTLTPNKLYPQHTKDRRGDNCCYSWTVVFWGMAQYNSAVVTDVSGKPAVATFRLPQRLSSPQWNLTSQEDMIIVNGELVVQWRCDADFGSFWLLSINLNQYWDQFSHKEDGGNTFLLSVATNKAHYMVYKIWTTPVLQKLENLTGLSGHQTYERFAFVLMDLNSYLVTVISSMLLQEKRHHDSLLIWNTNNNKHLCWRLFFTNFTYAQHNGTGRYGGRAL